MPPGDLRESANSVVSLSSEFCVLGSPFLNETEPPHRYPYPFLSPNHDVLASASEACLGTSSEPAEDKASLVSAGLESNASERSSRDIRAIEDLLGAVTKAVDRLKLDWPQE
ncbi:hypothetical protein E1301_Tti017622 [Triplophysa tibetana]|uniref:Uncharacterized protein n=1 Tax=Triplophysa tibetana TaxID=1572043 RepID=A0A5A9NLV8_9TELE|nr:hypothetical protein E1301_Tti017622 [Triplophysa tibetana]